MVPAWRGEGGRGREGRCRERDSRSLTYSSVTYRDKSDVKLMIGDDGGRENETGGRKQTQRHQQRFTVAVNQMVRYTQWIE